MGYFKPPSAPPSSRVLSGLRLLDLDLDGIIATNTTLARPAGLAFEGGLSGRPLAARAREGRDGPS